MILQLLPQFAEKIYSNSDWGRLQRETGKSLLPGVVGGYVAIQLQDGYSFSDAIYVFIVFYIIVLGMAFYEHKFGKPTQETQDGGESEVHFAS